MTGVILNASAKLGLIRWISKSLDPLVSRKLYICCIRPAVEYAHIVWAVLTALGCARLERLNRKTGRLILKLPASSNLPHDILLARAGLPTLTERRQFAQIKFLFQRSLQRQSSSWALKAGRFRLDVFANAFIASYDITRRLSALTSTMDGLSKVFTILFCLQSMEHVTM